MKYLILREKDSPNFHQFENRSNEITLTPDLVFDFVLASSGLVLEPRPIWEVLNVENDGLSLTAGLGPLEFNDTRLEVDWDGISQSVACEAAKLGTVRFCNNNNNYCKIKQEKTIQIFGSRQLQIYPFKHFHFSRYFLMLVK